MCAACGCPRQGETADKSKITALPAITQQNINDPKVAPFVYKCC
ncbi:hypothetical protein [Streptomyces sp. NPDC002619]